MEGEWHTLHYIGEVSNLLPEHETNTIIRYATRCINLEDLLNLSFILKVSVFSEAYLEPSRTYIVQFFCENR